MQKKLKTGDKVTILDEPVTIREYFAPIGAIGLEGTVVGVNEETACVDFGREVDGWSSWLFPLSAIKAPAPKVAKPVVAKPKTVKPKVAKPKKARSRLSLSHVLTLYPQTRKVLAHMEQHSSISPLEAFGVYRITRLAARINEIRDAGVEIITTMKRDATGTRYASYSLA